MWKKYIYVYTIQTNKMKWEHYNKQSQNYIHMQELCKPKGTTAVYWSRTVSNLKHKQNVNIWKYKAECGV